MALRRKVGAAASSRGAPWMSKKRLMALEAGKAVTGSPPGVLWFVGRTSTLVTRWCALKPAIRNGRQSASNCTGRVISNASAGVAAATLANPGWTSAAVLPGCCCCVRAALPSLVQLQGVPLDSPLQPPRMRPLLCNTAVVPPSAKSSHMAARGTEALSLRPRQLWPSADSE